MLVPYPSHNSNNHGHYESLFLDPNLDSGTMKKLIIYVILALYTCSNSLGFQKKIKIKHDNKLMMAIIRGNLVALYFLILEPKIFRYFL